MFKEKSMKTNHEIFDQSGYEKNRNLQNIPKNLTIGIEKKEKKLTNIQILKGQVEKNRNRNLQNREKVMSKIFWMNS